MPESRGGENVAVDTLSPKQCGGGGLPRLSRWDDSSDSIEVVTMFGGTEAESRLDWRLRPLDWGSEVEAEAAEAASEDEDLLDL